jgi:DNA modification methylase
MTITLYHGHVIDVLRGLGARSVHTCVTSPPYWGLRDYNLPPVEWPTVTYRPMTGLAEVTVQGCEVGCEHLWGIQQKVAQGGQSDFSSSTLKSDGRSEASRIKTLNENAKELQRQAPTGGQFCQHCGGWRGSLGLEPNPTAFVAHLVAVCREIWRVLRDDGTFWLNLGSSYAANRRYQVADGKWHDVGNNHGSRVPDGFKPKDLVPIPWMVALALQADGWYLRRDCIWAKGRDFGVGDNGYGSSMPESCEDRPVSSHEYIFLLTKKARYYYDAVAVRQKWDGGEHHLRSASITCVQFG